MTRDEWIEAFCQRIGDEPPSPETVETLLAVAGAAAHGSERTAAPIACWLVGRANLGPEAALSLAREISGESDAG